MNTIYNYVYQFQANAEYLAILVLVFLSVFIVASGAFFLIVRNQILSQRMARVLNTAEAPDRSPKLQLFEQDETGLLAKISKPLSNLHQPQEETDIRKIRLKLIQGGLRSKRAYRFFLASKTFTPILLASTYFLKSSFYKVSTNSISISLLLFAAGFFLPDLFISHRTEKRREGMRKALPEALDLMVVCVESGLGLDMTFKRVGDELKEIDAALSDEFHLTNLEVKAGKSRSDSFKNMALRTGIPEISNLMTMLIQTSRFGTSVADALRVHADAMRVKRRQMAEERAAKMAVKIVFPLIVFILPALFIVVLGPAGIKIVETIIIPATTGGG